MSRPQLGSVPYGVAIYHCEVYGDIALTYDDGPWDYTSDLLDLLKVCLLCHPLRHLLRKLNLTRFVCRTIAQKLPFS